MLDHKKLLKAEQDRRYREKHQEKIRQKKKAYYLANKETIAKRVAEKYLLNPDPIKERARRYKKENPAKVNAACMERYVIKMSRRPKWEEELTIFTCSEAYDKARMLTKITGIPHDVDHIVPLKGKTVSGLHVFSNLQILPSSENRRKKNTYWPDMWGA